MWPVEDGQGIASRIGPVDKVGYFKIAAKKMTWKPRKEPLQEWDTSISLT